MYLRQKHKRLSSVRCVVGLCSGAMSCVFAVIIVVVVNKDTSDPGQGILVSARVALKSKHYPGNKSSYGYRWGGDKGLEVETQPAKQDSRQICITEGPHNKGFPRIEGSENLRLRIQSPEL